MCGCKPDNPAMLTCCAVLNIAHQRLETSFSLVRAFTHGPGYNDAVFIFLLFVFFCSPQPVWALGGLTGAGSQEAVPELMAAWGTFVSELHESAQSAKEVALAVQETIVGKLQQFTDELGPRHDRSIASGKKSLFELKQQVADLAQKQVAYSKLSAEVAEDIALVAPAYEPADQAEVEEIISLAGPQLAAAVGIHVTTPVPPPLPHARLSSFDDHGNTLPGRSEITISGSGGGSGSGDGDAAIGGSSELDLEAAGLGLAPMMDGAESLGTSAATLRFGSTKDTAISNGSSIVTVANAAGKSGSGSLRSQERLGMPKLPDPQSMTPPQKRRFANRMAAMTSPSVQAALHSKELSTQEYKEGIDRVTEKYDDVMFTQIPEVLHEIGTNELQRVSFMKHCVGHIITGLQAHGRRTLGFHRTQTQLDTIVSGRVNQCTMTVAPPPRPAFSDPASILVSPVRESSGFAPFEESASDAAAPGDAPRAAVPPAMPTKSAPQPAEQQARPQAAPLATMLPVSSNCNRGEEPHPAAVHDRHLSSPYFDASKLMLGMGADGSRGSPSPSSSSLSSTQSRASPPAAAGLPANEPKGR